MISIFRWETDRYVDGSWVCGIVLDVSMKNEREHKCLQIVDDGRLNANDDDQE